MEFKWSQPPRMPAVAVSYRGLYREGAFWQREMISSDELAAMAKRRGIAAIASFMQLDENGAFEPIAFVEGHYPSGTFSPPAAIESLKFREERPFADWSTYEWSPWEHPTVTERYSSWQILYLRDAVTFGRVDVEIELLLDDSESALLRTHELLREILATHQAHWRRLDGNWRTMIKLLVRLQNRYWPLIRGTSKLLTDASGQRIDPFPGTVEAFDPGPVLVEFALEVEDVAGIYRYLSDRGAALDTADGQSLLRLAARREMRRDWRGDVLLAADFYDAARVIGAFYRELTGTTLPLPDVAHDERLDEARERLLGHPPTVAIDRDDIKRTLVSLHLDPVWVHVVGEGESERILVEGLVGALLHPQIALSTIKFTDLAGSGSAERVAPLLDTVVNYATRSVVIVDSEGQMRDYAEAAVRDGLLPKEDLCLFHRSLEQDNYTAQELVEFVAELGRKLDRGELRMTGADLDRYYAERKRKAEESRTEEPALARCLLDLAMHEEHGLVKLKKKELAEGMVNRLVGELQTAGDGGRNGLLERRPILKFVIERVIDAINRPVPVYIEPG